MWTNSNVAGFKDHEIEVHYPHGKGEAVEEDALAGAITGGMVGAAAGAVATGLIPGVGPLVASGVLARRPGRNRSGSDHRRCSRCPRRIGCPGRKGPPARGGISGGAHPGRCTGASCGAEWQWKSCGAARKPSAFGCRPTLTGETKRSFLKKLWRGRNAADYCTEGETYLGPRRVRQGHQRFQRGHSSRSAQCHGVS